MHRIQLFLLIAAGVLLAAPATADLDELNRSVVKIHSHLVDQADETGAGIVVRLDGGIAYILTAFHVVDGAETIEVEFHDDPVRRFSAELLRFDEPLDIAVIFVDDDRIPTELPKFSLPIATNLTEGTEVAAIGHQPGNLDWQVSRETVTNENDPLDPRIFLFTKGGIDRGNSGGPILSGDALIGVVVAKKPTFGAAVKIDNVLPYLDQWRVDYSQLERVTLVAEEVGSGDPEPPAREPPETAGSTEASGVVVVKTTPPEAMVYLDRERMGTTENGELVLEDLAPGQRELTVLLRGYQRWTDRIDVQNDREIQVLVQLQPMERETTTTTTTRPSSGTVTSTPIFKTPILKTPILKTPQASCKDLVQGKIAWDYSGKKQWGTANLERLCKGTKVAAEPGRCFDQVMHGGIDHGNGTRWSWSQAVDLCEGTSSASRTISCFKGGILRKRSQAESIKMCGGRY